MANAIYGVFATLITASIIATASLYVQVQVMQTKQDALRANCKKLQESVLLYQTERKLLEDRRRAAPR